MYIGKECHHHQDHQKDVWCETAGISKKASKEFKYKTQINEEQKQINFHLSVYVDLYAVYMLRCCLNI